MEDISDFSAVQVYTAGRFEMSATIRDEFCAKGLNKTELFGDAYAFI